MEVNRGSLTALITAYARAYHARQDGPKVFDDFVAARLFTDEEFTALGQQLAQSLPLLDPESAEACPDHPSALAAVMRIHAPTPLSRARFTEERLETAIGQGVQQYVILGAGMDTFAFRRPDLLRRLRVFELDHPATQAAKRQRLASFGMEQPAQLQFVPVDFNQEPLAAALQRSSYNPHQLSFFSWLGVTYYLDRTVVFNTLQSVAQMAPAGSTVVFDFLDADAFVPGRADKSIERMLAITSRVGEAMKTGLDTATLAADLAGVGLHLEEHLTPVAIEKRYFAGRSDGYHAAPHTHFARAVVK